MLSSLKDFALGLIGQNPALQRNPNAQVMIDAIKSGDSRRGQEIAQNLCNTYGVKPEDALSQARRFFNI